MDNLSRIDIFLAAIQEAGLCEAAKKTAQNFSFDTNCAGYIRTAACIADVWKLLQCSKKAPEVGVEILGLVVEREKISEALETTTQREKSSIILFRRLHHISGSSKEKDIKYISVSELLKGMEFNVNSLVIELEEAELALIEEEELRRLC